MTNRFVSSKQITFHNSCTLLYFVTDWVEIFLFFPPNQSLQEFDPGDSVFDATEWTDLSDGFNGKWKKKVNIQIHLFICVLYFSMIYVAVTLKILDHQTMPVDYIY